MLRHVASTNDVFNKMCYVKKYIITKTSEKN